MEHLQHNGNYEKTKINMNSHVRMFREMGGHLEMASSQNENKLWVSPTGALISNGDYQFLSEHQKQQCRPYKGGNEIRCDYCYKILDGYDNLAEAEEIAKTILYFPVTNGQAERSIQEGAKLIEEYKNNQWVEIVAFAQWAGALGGKVPFPKNPGGSVMNYYELYRFWQTCDKRDIYLKHAANYPNISKIF